MRNDLSFFFVLFFDYLSFFLRLLLPEAVAVGSISGTHASPCGWTQ